MRSRGRSCSGSSSRSCDGACRARRRVPPPHRRRPPRRRAQPSALHAHPRPGGGARRDRGRSRRSLADGTPPAGRRRLGKDARGAALGAARERRRGTGRHRRTDRAARTAARGECGPAAGADRGAGRLPLGNRGRRAAAAAARGARGGRGRHPVRHARAVLAGRRLPAARAGRGRRAAQVRRPAADGHARQGGSAGPAADDRDADPAHPRAHGVRGPRRVDHPHHAPGTPPGDHPPRPAGERGEGVPARARGARPGTPGLLRLPAHRGGGGGDDGDPAGPSRGGR